MCFLLPYGRCSREVTERVVTFVQPGLQHCGKQAQGRFPQYSLAMGP